MMKQLGYTGFYNSASSLPDAIAMFYPVDVVETEFDPRQQQVASLDEERRRRALVMNEPEMEEAMLEDIEMDTPGRADD